MFVLRGISLNKNKRIFFTVTEGIVSYVCEIWAVDYRFKTKLLTLRLLMSYIYIYISIYMEHPFLMFLDHTQRRTAVGRTPLDE